MVTFFIRRMKNLRWEYIWTEKQQFRGQVTRRIYLLPQTLQVFENGEEKVAFRKVHLLHNIFAALPVLSFFLPRSPFTLFYNGEPIATEEHMPFHAVYRFVSSDAAYELALHNGNKVSLVKNHAQVALYEKDRETWFEESHYTAYHTDDMEPEMLFAFLLYMDAQYFPTMTTLASNRLEKAWVIDDPFPQRARWLPNNR